MTSSLLGRVNTRLAAPFVLAALFALSPHASSQVMSNEGGLSEVQTHSLVVRYQGAKHWSLKSIVLLALGERWHPEGAEIVIAALTDRDPHLRAYGISTLRATSAEHLPSVATPALVDTLIKKSLSEKDDHYRAEVVQVLQVIFPDAKLEKPSKWKSYWRTHQETYTPAEWIGPGVPADPSGRSTSAGVFERAMDLHESGLEVVICIDSTGSMQTTIDASRDAVDDIVSILQGVAPDFRLGLVHYKDFGDMGKVPAKVLEPLAKRPEKVSKRLSKLSAGGGGDIPERVEVGLEIALSKDLKWKRTTNKLIVLIGDAPPHGGGAEQAAIKLVKDAHERPFGLDPTDIKATKRDGRSRTNKVVRPFVTAAIAVGGNEIAPRTKASFERIAKAGGGAYASLLTGEAPGKASREIARHIMLQSFGMQWKNQMDQFVDIYFDYRDQGFFE